MSSVLGVDSKTIVVFAVVAACAAATQQYTCTDFRTGQNFIESIAYTQRSLTDSCSNGVCDANPVYGERNCPKKAIRFCEAECDRLRADEGCTGFFFQKHTNGHEICGFYKSDMHATTAQWVHHNHKFGAVCEHEGADSSRQPTPHSEEKNDVKLVQATVKLAGRSSEIEAGQKVYDFAFQTIIAASAGHVCGSDGSEPCSPREVLITSYHGFSFTFQLRVANGQLATRAVANIKLAMEDGSVIIAGLQTAGLHDIDSLKRMILGDVEIHDDKSVVDVQVSHTEEHKPNATTSRLLRVLRVFRCPKAMSVLLGAVLLLVLLGLFLRRLARPKHIQLAETATPQEVIIAADTPTKYAPISETTKDDATSKHQV